VKEKEKEKNFDLDISIDEETDLTELIASAAKEAAASFNDSVAQDQLMELDENGSPIHSLLDRDSIEGKRKAFTM
jgi:hypothetical protein